MALNVPVVDAKLQGRVLVSLRASLELVTSFATQLSTLHSYLQQVSLSLLGHFPSLNSDHHSFMCDTYLQFLTYTLSVVHTSAL